MIDLKLIDLGRDDAETDRNLREYFIQTALYRDSINSSKWLVLGRKGSGKSAIFKMLENKEDLKDTDIVIPITPDEYSWGALKQYKELGISTELAHTNAWKFTIITTVASYIVNQYSTVGGLLEKFKNFLLSNFKTSDKLTLRLISQKLSGISITSLDLSSLGIELKEGVIVPDLLQRMKEDIISVIKEMELKFYIQFDKLDDCWDASNESKSILIGLLKACQDLNGSMRPQVKLIIFLRTDIYNMLQFHDRDKFRQEEMLISWNNQLLRDIITERIKYSLNIPKEHLNKDIWNEIFGHLVFRSNHDALKYITDRTFMRPRDMILFCRRIIDFKKEQDVDSKISRDDVTSAFKQYSLWKLGDLTDTEYHLQYKELNKVLNLFKRGFDRYKRSELTEIFDKAKVNNINISNFDEFIKILFDTGTMGAYRAGGVGGGSRHIFNYNDPTISLSSENDFILHPALYSALDIKMRYT